MSSQKSGVKYDFPPLEIYMFVNLPSNWKVIQLENRKFHDPVVENGCKQ